MSPKGPYTLVTVNNAPERATRLVGRVIETVKEQYTIRHVANAESKQSLPSSCLPKPSQLTDGTRQAPKQRPPSWSNTSRTSSCVLSPFYALLFRTPNDG